MEFEKKMPLEKRMELEERKDPKLRQVRVRYDMRLTRMSRNLTRCTCGHSDRVHLDKVCQMERCNCEKYSKRRK